MPNGLDDAQLADRVYGNVNEANRTPVPAGLQVGLVKPVKIASDHFNETRSSSMHIDKASPKYRIRRCGKLVNPDGIRALY